MGSTDGLEVFDQRKFSCPCLQSEKKNSSIVKIRTLSHTDYSQTELSRLQIFQIIFTSHEFLTAVVIETVSLVVLTPCRPVSGYQHFGGLKPGDGGRMILEKLVNIHQVT